MIKNSKQAAITKAKLEVFKKDLAVFEKTQKEVLHPVRFQLGINSFNGIIKDLSDQLEKYNQLTKANINDFIGYKLTDLAKVLIGARLAKDMSQKDLATKIGIQEQQIQRYEQDDYEKASWGRILEVHRALDLNIDLAKFRVTRQKEQEAKHTKARRWLLPKNMRRELADRANRSTKVNKSLFQFQS